MKNKSIIGLIEIISMFFLMISCDGEHQKGAEKMSDMDKQNQTVFKSSLAGNWYSANSADLKEQIKNLFEKATSQDKRRTEAVALILPHAGYRYSGETAAYGLKALTKNYKRIVIIGPSHCVSMQNVLSVYDVPYYETPLGRVAVDSEFIAELLKHSIFQDIPAAHKTEHSAQIQVPLLQYCQKDFKIVPIIAGQCSADVVAKAGRILKELVDDDTLVIASSDFVHYGTRFAYVPFTENVPEQIKKLDYGAYEFISQLKVGEFLEYIEKTGATICGYIPVAILLSMLPESSEASLIKYSTSGEITGDYDNSVSYLSVAFYGAWDKRGEVKPENADTELTEGDKKLLLSLARKSLVYFLEKRKVPELPDLNIEINSRLEQQRAVFVTLKKDGNLRGCIGEIFPRQPLYNSVISNAINAGVYDPRFNPVSREECDELSIEISALTVPHEVSSYDKIRIGTDGVVLRKHGRSAVFLPQVAPEQGWNLEQTLTHLSLKACLPADAWKKEAAFLTFQAVVFGEEE